jgi:hypothetical protein
MHRDLITRALLFSLMVYSAHVFGDLCAPLSRKSAIRLDASFDNNTDLQAQPGAELEATRYGLSAMISPSKLYLNGYDGSVGVVHKYDILSDHGLTPDARTNGHLHTLALPWQWTRKSSQLSRRFGVAAAVSTSSNGLKNPHKLDHQALQLWLSWEDSRRINGDWDWVMGVCGDHRFGTFRIYPVAGIERKLAGAARLRLAYPDLRLHWPVNSRLLLDLRIEPVGNEWSVYDNDLEKGSRFLWNSWSASAKLTWHLLDGFSVTIDAGRHYDQELEFELNDGSRLRADLDSSVYWSVGLIWWL